MAGAIGHKAPRLKLSLSKMFFSRSFIHSCPGVFNILKSLLVERCHLLNHLIFRRAPFLSEGFLMRLDVWGLKLVNLVRGRGAIQIPSPLHRGNDSPSLLMQRCVPTATSLAPRTESFWSMPSNMGKRFKVRASTKYILLSWHHLSVSQI